MTTPPRPPVSGFLGQEFNDFLFAAVCTEQNGRVLTVLSLLARLDFDPWAQAAGFGRMSRKTAITELSDMIAGLPEHTAMTETPNVAAKRLIGLLPAPNAPKPAKSSPWRNIMRKWRAAFVARQG